MEMNIQTAKVELIQWLNSLNDTVIIQKVLDLRNNSMAKGQTTTLEEKEAIQYGIDDAENGKLNPHSEARKVYEKWL